MRLPLAQLAPGMVLAEAVVGPGGRQLAAAGTALTAQHLALFKAWGIADAEVTGGRGAGPDPAALAAAQRAVAPRFRGQPVEHPAVRACFQEAVQRQLRAAGRP